MPTSIITPKRVTDAAGGLHASDLTGGDDLGVTTEGEFDTTRRSEGEDGYDYREGEDEEGTGEETEEETGEEETEEETGDMSEEESDRGFSFSDSNDY